MLCALLFVNPALGDDLDDELRLIFSAQSDVSSMQSAFVQTKNLSLFDETIESTGTIVIEKPGFYCWTYESPERSIFYIDGKRTGFYLPETGERDEVDLDKSSGLASIIQSITSIITGNLESSTLTDFEVSRTSSFNGFPAYVFTPRTEELQSLFERVTIRFDEHNKLARDLQILENNGDTTDMTFENWLTNIPVDRSMLLN